MEVSSHVRLPLLTRCALAIAAMHALGCEDRERWPEKSRERPRPMPVLTADAFECNHGTFCVPAPAAVEVSATAPHEDCSAFTHLAPDAARSVKAEIRATLRVRFNAEETTRARSAQSDACCYTWFEHCRGRPLVIGGHALVADVVERAGWAAAPLALAKSPLQACSWQREAAHEHASVAAFLRLANQLMVLDAPHTLIEGATRAAHEELRHAKIAFTIASSWAGVPLGPARLTLPVEPTLSHTELAVTTYLEGCVAETVAAAILRAALVHLPPVVRRLMRSVAADEERHAAYSWRLAAWFAREQASRAAIAAMAERVTCPHARDALPSYGVIGPGERRSIAMTTLAQIVRPLTRALLSEPPIRSATRVPSPAPPP